MPHQPGHGGGIPGGANVQTPTPNLEVQQPWHTQGYYNTQAFVNNWLNRDNNNDRSDYFDLLEFGGTGGAGGGGLGGMDPYTAMAMGSRGSGGTGGGSTQTEGNMDANELIALSEFLGENVTSFAYGGKMKNPYQYAGGGHMKKLVNQMAALDQIDKVVKANKGMKYDMGGYLKSERGKKNLQDIATKIGLPSNIMNMSQSKRHLAMRDFWNKPPQFSSAKAAYGMKMKKRYTQGGRF